MSILQAGAAGVSAPAPFSVLNGGDGGEARDAWLKNEAAIAADVELRLEAFKRRSDEATRESNNLEKQRKLLDCRLEQRALKQSAETCREVGEKHGVTVDFLEDMQSELKAMDGKLDNLQAEVTAVHEDLKR